MLFWRVQEKGKMFSRDKHPPKPACACYTNSCCSEGCRQLVRGCGKGCGQQERDAGLHRVVPQAALSCSAGGLLAGSRSSGRHVACLPWPGSG